MIFLVLTTIPYEICYTPLGKSPGSFIENLKQSIVLLGFGNTGKYKEVIGLKILFFLRVCAC